MWCGLLPHSYSSVSSWRFEGAHQLISRALSVLLSLLWRSALRMLATAACLDSHRHFLIPERPWGSVRFPLSVLPPGYSSQGATWALTGLTFVGFCSFGDYSPLPPQIQCLEYIVSCILTSLLVVSGCWVDAFGTELVMSERRAFQTEGTAYEEPGVS